MSEFKKCPVCKQWGWSGAHTCPPAYGVRLEDSDPSDEEEVRADSPEEAAKAFLDKHYYDLEYPNSATVIVNDWRAHHNRGHLYTFNVTVEMAPVFHAEQISDAMVPDDEEEVPNTPPEEEDANE